MTDQQIKYYQALEERRSNLVREKETQRSNVAQESEARRHNIAMENYNLSALNETNRHNVATESEASMHNRAVESANLMALNETVRSHMASEQLGTLNLSEETRHHVAVENETTRANVARETETKRTNLALEELKREQQAVEKQYKETSLWLTKAQNDLNKQRLNADKAYQRQQIAIQWAQLDNARNQYKEAVSHNKANEINDTFNTFMKIVDTTSKMLERFKLFK